MKRLLIVIAVAAAASVVVDELGDLTQSRPDPVRERGDGIGAVVDEDRFAPGEADAAAALWAICAAQTSSRVIGTASCGRSATGATASFSGRPSDTTSRRS